MKKISWITPDYFIETDIHIVPELTRFYSIEWYIVYTTDIPFYKTLSTLNDKENLKINYWKLPQSNMFSPKQISFYNSLVNSVLSQNPSFIYTAILNYPFIPIAALKLPRKITTLAAHNVITPKGSKHYSFIKNYLNFSYSFFSNFQTFSNSQFKILNQLYPKKNVFMAPFILKNYGMPTNKCNPIITFLFYGRIRGYKCPEVVIKAAEAASKKTNVKFKVIIAGACDDWGKYASQITQPELFDLRIYSIPDEDVPNLFGETHYTLLPYQDIAQSGALFVCINYAKPSILSDLPAFKEILTDNNDAIFIEKASIKDLTEKMVYVLNNHHTIYPKLEGNLKLLRDTQFNKENIINQYKKYINQF